MFRQETVTGGETILTVIGPVAGEVVVEFGKKIEALASGRATTVTLDLSQCTAMNSEAIGKLLVLRMRLGEQKKALRIEGCSPQLWSIFKTIKMDILIPMEP
jgi:anti-anti-sigma regulatory factor